MFPRIFSLSAEAWKKSCLSVGLLLVSTHVAWADTSLLNVSYDPAREAQTLVAKNYYRPVDPAVAARYAKTFPPVKLIGIDDPMFGGWHNAQAKHFADGGVFDQIFEPN